MGRKCDAGRGTVAAGRTCLLSQRRDLAGPVQQRLVLTPPLEDIVPGKFKDAKQLTNAYQHTMEKILVEFGTLQNVFGWPAKYDDFTLVPAAVELHGTAFTVDFHLRDLVGTRPPDILAGPIEHHYDVAWVRGRLPRVFGFTPELSEVEKSLLDVGFIAVEAGSSVAFPFVCCDYYGRTRLMFSPEGPAHDTQRKIATAFWSLLLADPEDLEDFEATVYHPGANIWMHFGCENGEPTFGESEDGDE